MASKKTGQPTKHAAGPGPRLVGGDGDDPQPQVLHPCVVLAAANQPLADTLHTALLEAGLTPRVEHDPRMAMAEVCLLRREARQRRGSGTDRSTAAPLILLNTAEHVSEELLAAMQQHVPDIPVLHFDGVSLKTMHEADDAPPERPPVIVQPQPEVSDDELSSLLRTPSEKASNS